MRLVRERYRPVSLDDITRAMTQDGVPDGSVAVTFDDGYEDNLTEAAPVLHAYGIPATVFVVTGYVGTEREFWWDALERILLTPGLLPECLGLEAGKNRFRFELGTAAEYTPAQMDANRRWNWRSEADPTSRHSLFRRLSAFLRPMQPSIRDRALHDLLVWAGVDPTPRPTHRVLTRDQLRQLVGSGLINLGGHSVSHPVLSRLTARERRDEVVESRQFLNTVVDREVGHFAYPYGVAGRSRRAVRRAGYRSGWGTRAGLVSRGSHLYEMPRLYVGDWEADEFEQRLRSCA
jgi:peptidoglycan/xylan/chitin deacetylase (PgdA/CDA1 family)